ncbi:MAG: PKD domain-containing protein, partial [Gemmatimonadetes bacterium]|nr:PKD domain-containing protein [Gemmatimonadota bacterium]
MGTVMPMRYLATCVAAFMLSVPPASAAGPLEPNPEFDPGTIELARFLRPDTDVLVEPESVQDRPEGWRVVTSEWLRTGCSGGEALLMAGAGDTTVELPLPAPGEYHLWVRSHGAATREFRVWVDDQEANVPFGDATMSWRKGGTFKVERTTATLRFGAAKNNPYFDCAILTRDAALDPNELRPLRAWAGDELWARAGEGVGFTGRYSMGRIATWRWEFSDGGTRDERDIGHTFAQPGDYTVTLTATSATGETHSHSLTAHVLEATDYTVARIPIRRAASPRYGDLNGDGEIDFLVGDPYRWVDAYLSDGTFLWSYDSPAEFPTPPQRREHPMVIWDFDGDGRGEVAMWRYLDGAEWLCLCDGLTGGIEKKVPWPVPEGYINGRLAVGNLTGEAAGATILMFNGQFLGDLQQADAYEVVGPGDPTHEALNHLWSYSAHGSDILGHFIYSLDLDGDLREEAFVSAAMIRPDGSVAWERQDLRTDHADSMRIGDLNLDGKAEVAYCYSSQGAYVLDAATGATLWHDPTNHAQQIEIADVRPDVPGIEVIVGDRFYLPDLRAKLLIYSADGQRLTETPRVAIAGNPNLGVLEWDGNPGAEIAWSNMILNGRGEVIAVLPAGLHHAFDFCGDGKEESVRTLQDRDGKLYLVAYGCKAGT